jgi:hypothetical protein
MCGQVRSLALLVLLLALLQVCVSLGTQNLTVYRVTPKNYSGLTNMNSGDAAGDAYFAIYELTFPLYCQQNKWDLSCSSTGILNIPNFNVYTKSVVEVDSRFGLYSGCTPDPNTGIFKCDPYSSDCWWNATGPSKLNSFTQFEGVPGCDHTAKGCHCKAWQEQAFGYYMCPECDRHASWHNQTALWKDLEDIAIKLNGSWYSTRSEGECTGSQVVGVDCWWREVEVQRTINATCLGSSLKSAIVSNYPECFHACPQPKNATSDCWIQCLLQSVNGGGPVSALKRSKPPTPMTRDTIVSAFTAPFLPVAQGGCPELATPDPDPALSPGAHHPAP